MKSKKAVYSFLKLSIKDNTRNNNWEMHYFKSLNCKQRKSESKWNFSLSCFLLKLYALINIFTHCSCTIFVLISLNTSRANFDFNWCSVSTECYFCFGKSSNCQDHSSGSHHPVKKFTPQNTPHLLSLIGKPCIVPLA